MNKNEGERQSYLSDQSQHVDFNAVGERTRRSVTTSR